MRKLLNAKVLVRKLMGIETSGSIDILFVDKTGTLTKGQFEPQCFISGSGNSYQNYEATPAALRDILTFTLRESTSATLGKDGKPMGGNSSDRALLSFLKPELLSIKSDTTVVREILFSSQRKFSASQLRIGKNNQGFPRTESITLVKGATDLILPSCSYFYAEDGKSVPMSAAKGALSEALIAVSKRGIRVIAIATSESPLKDEILPTPLTLIGIIGIKDDIRKESKPALDLARQAGIQVVMITGDIPETAVAVAEELELLKGNKTVLTSSQLESLSDEQLQGKLRQIGVICKALPTDKSRFVKVCQDLNLVVGMTGDGVNDSAALKRADVGFAMGSGSEVAKEASNIVILDDNFYSITQAVLYGRTIFKSIRKFVVFQSTVNAASMIIVFMGPFLGFDFPLTLIQLLWVNLVMDTLAAMAFGGEPALLRYMSEKPVPRNAPIITADMWSAIIVNGFFIALLCVCALIYPPVRLYFVRDGVPDEKVFLTAFFAFFIFLTTFNAFNARTPTMNLLDHITENTGFVLVIMLIFAVQITFTYLGGNILRTVPLTMQEWILIIGASVLIIPFDILRKLAMRRLTHSK